MYEYVQFGHTFSISGSYLIPFNKISWAKIILEVTIVSIQCFAPTNVILLLGITRHVTKEHHPHCFRCQLMIFLLAKIFSEISHLRPNYE